MVIQSAIDYKFRPGSGRDCLWDDGNNHEEDDSGQDNINGSYWYQMEELNKLDHQDYGINEGGQ